MDLRHLPQNVMAGILLALCSHAALAQVVVIVSPSNPLTVLSSEQVTDIFLGRTASFPDGSAVIPIDQAEGSAARHEFYQKVTGKSVQWLRAYWSKLIFTGRGEPPKEASDAAAVKKMVNEHKHFIAYIDRNSVDQSVKVVLTVR